MYQLVQLIRHNIPCLWNFIEASNAALFKIRYGRKLKLLPALVREFSNDTVCYRLAEADDASKLEDFFRKQPRDAFEYFKPHDFDSATIRKLISNQAFLMLLAEIDSTVVGYAFLRCFANGKAFRGKIVDIQHRGKGIAKAFGLQTTAIASALGVGLYGTISKANAASMASSKSSNDIKVIEELPEDYLLIQYLPKH